MAKAWIAHVKKTKEMYPQIMQKGGLKAIILKAKETYKKQSGGRGHPMGGKVETMVDQGAEVAGVSMGRAVGAGAHENAKLENAHTMGGGKKGKRGGDGHDEGPEPEGPAEPVGDDLEHKGPEHQGPEHKGPEDKGPEDNEEEEDKGTGAPPVPFGGKKSKKGKKTKKAKKSKKSKTAKKGGKKTKKVKKAKKAKKAKKTRSRK